MPPPEGFRDATMSVDASEDGVAVTLGPRLATLRWEDCVRLSTDRRCYVLHFSRDEFLVVPRRAFRNERRDAAFRDLVTSCMRGARGASDDAATESAAAEPEQPAAEAEEAAPAPAPEAEANPAPSEPVKAGRNDPCPCGSGKKYKKCCLGGSDSPG